MRRLMPTAKTTVLPANDGPTIQKGLASCEAIRRQPGSRAPVSSGDLACAVLIPRSERHSHELRRPEPVGKDAIDSTRPGCDRRGAGTGARARGAGTARCAGASATVRAAHAGRGCLGQVLRQAPNPKGELQRVRLSAVCSACGFLLSTVAGPDISGVLATLCGDRLELVSCVERIPGWLVLRAVLPGGHRLCPIPAD
jgi:hypothetical protein